MPFNETYSKRLCDEDTLSLRDRFSRWPRVIHGIRVLALTFQVQEIWPTNIQVYAYARAHEQKHTYAGDGGTLVVAAKHKKVFWIKHFVAQQQTKRLDPLPQKDYERPLVMKFSRNKHASHPHLLICSTMFTPPRDCTLTASNRPGCLDPRSRPKRGTYFWGEGLPPVVRVPIQILT